MWIRTDLKERAKQFLKKHYWNAFVGGLVLLLSGSSLLSGTSFNYTYDKHDKTTGVFLKNDLIATLSIIFVLISILAFIFYRIFVGYSLEVGATDFFIRGAEKGESKLCFTRFFNKKHYKNVVKTMISRDFYIFLWSLLLIIPGIIMYFTYLMVPYILADNPNIDPKRARELSDKMTMGHKFDIFVLGLSFFWWYILAGILAGMGFIFLNPYILSTYGELYLVLREEAILSDITSYEELNLINPKDESANSSSL